MSEDRFKFISPGVFIEEVDKSFIPELPDRMGPVVVGRFKKGPSNRPIKVKSYNELVEVFGTPAPGNASGDIWRSGAMTAPTYAAYAAQAWLRNNTPCTIVRLLGVQHPDAVSYATNTTAPAGWRTDNMHSQASATATGGAYGLFVMPDPDSTTHGATAASVALTIDPLANMQSGAGLAGHILLGVPTHISGGLANGGANTAPIATNCLAFTFVTTANVGGAGDNVVEIDAGVADTTNPDTGMTNFAALINGTLAAASFDAGDQAGDNVALAAVQAAYSASWVATNDTSGVLTLTTTAGGNRANYHVVIVDEQMRSTGDALTVTLGVEAIDAASLGTGNTLTASTAAVVTGTLAASWYCQDGYVQLMGTPRDLLADDDDNPTPVTSSAVWIKSTDQKFHVRVASGSGNGTVLQGGQVNFDPTSDKFIRKTFNTDPTATNSDLVDTSAGAVLQKYWLGETFEDHVRSHMKTTPLVTTGSFVSGTQVSASSTGDFLGCVVGLNQAAGSTVNRANRLAEASAAGTGWFFSNDKRGEQPSGEANGFDPTDETHVEKLFRFVALDNGEHLSRDIKISLSDIKAPPNNFVKYGTFTVLVRDAQDTDNKPVVLERYTGVNLDPKSSSYIVRVMGDKEYSYDSVSKTVRQFGSYENRSKYVRVVVSPYVDAGSAEGLLPYGVYGPVVPLPLRVEHLAGVGGGGATTTIHNALTNTALTAPWIAGANVLPIDSLQDMSAIPQTLNSPIDADGSDTILWDAGSAALTASVEWPSSRIRVSASEGNLVKQTQAYWGYQSNRAGTRIFSEENHDHFRGAPANMDVFATASGETHYSWIFTLDDLKVTDSAADGTITAMAHVTGSRADGSSRTVTSGSENIVDEGFNRFTSPVFGGRDGLDITEKDPFRNRYLRMGSSETTNYAYHTIQRAVDVLSDPEFVEFDLATIPGCTHETLTDNLVVACESRGDALAIIDLSGSYEPPHEIAGTAAAPASRRTGSVDDVVAGMKSRGLNSSYGCAFFPFVQIRDTVSDAILFVPPSVVALGTMSSSQRKSAVWFAPAGFTRGGLSEGSSGLPVVGVRTRVTSDQRDKLYDANINPIASFPAEGIVVFGQKTLQVTPSALDRINVRRLLIFLKKEISLIASRTLFEQNVQATWDRFTGQVNPFLDGVKAGLGLTDFRVVLDNTTTTEDMIDRNILYAKIFLKPARAIEFIALDFIITRTGASFDD